MQPVTTVLIERAAQRTLRKLPANISSLIVAKIEAYAAAPESLANMVKAMQGNEYKGLLRLRVGDWRVLMAWDGATLVIYEIGGRGEIYG